VNQSRAEQMAERVVSISMERNPQNPRNPTKDQEMGKHSNQKPQTTRIQDPTKLLVGTALANSHLKPKIGGIQEAIFEEKSSGFFLHKKRRFFLLATKYKQDYILVTLDLS
jgi:hypothetical protein